MNQSIVNFAKNTKPASIEDERSKEENVKQNDVVILPGSSDEDSFFGLRSMALKRNKKSSNIKQRDNVLMWQCLLMLHFCLFHKC